MENYFKYKWSKWLKVKNIKMTKYMSSKQVLSKISSFSIQWKQLVERKKAIFTQGDLITRLKCKMNDKIMIWYIFLVLRNMIGLN